jgi:hypothetical protein
MIDIKLVDERGNAELDALPRRGIEIVFVTGVDAWCEEEEHDASSFGPEPARSSAVAAVDARRMKSPLRNAVTSGKLASACRTARWSDAMSNTSDDNRIMLDRQDLALDPDGLLDAPEELESSEREELERAEQQSGDEVDLPVQS